MSMALTRFGANDPSMPAVLPSLASALSRRRAIFGAVALAAVPAAASALSPNDARLVAIATELCATYEACNRMSAATDFDEDAPAWDALLGRFEPLTVEMEGISADTMAGVLAKARALQIPTVAEALNDIGPGLAADLVRLSGAGASA